MTTEYEQLLASMIAEKKAKAAELTGKTGKEKELAGLASDIRFLEVEAQRYQQGMALFRSKNLPKVGRWGRPEAEEAREEQSAP
jgi:arginine utilization protein RocB